MSGDTSGSDAPRGSDGGGSDDAMCFGSQGSGGYYVCAPSVPGAPATLNGPIMTDDGKCTNGFFAMLGMPDGTSEKVCVYDGTSVTVQSVVATGTYPLVIASTGDVTIGTLLDVSTQSGGQHGAGHNPPACNVTNNITGGSDPRGGGGGAGGSFVTQGGSGGTGGGSGGMPIAAQLPTTLRGGCPGGGGGDGSGNTITAGQGGTAGWGGGAVFVVAKGNIIVNGTINASGEHGYGGTGGGGGTHTGGGGSGGGAGGMILLDAGGMLMISSNATLVADGGGGGGGGDTAGGAGQTGSNADPANPQKQPGGGGGGGANGGAGGSGAARSGASTDGAPPKGSGGGAGGGGGGEGAIVVVHGGVPAASNNISPDAQPAS